MKKYVKPELFFEQFELSENIAVCGWQLNQEMYTCGYEAVADNEWYGMDLVIIDGTVGGCRYHATAEMYCYMTMSDNQNTITS